MNSRKSSKSKKLKLESLEHRGYFAAHIVGSNANYATIQAAVDAANAGATVTVDAGTYAEEVIVYKTLTLRGAKAGVDARTRSTANESVLTGTSANNAVTSSFYITANNVTLDGFTVQGETNKSTTRGAGIVIAPNVYGTSVLNNIVQNNVAGLFLANSSSTYPAVIQRNLFQNNNNAGVNGGRGIYTDGEISGGNITNVTIDNNTFYNNRGSSGTTSLESAVAFEAHSAGRQSNVRITSNTFNNNGKSVLFFNTVGVVIQGNTVTRALDWYSGSLRFEGNNQNVSITYNTIFNNTGPGVAVDSNGTPGDSSGFVVRNNNIYGNGTTSGGKLGVVVNKSVYTGAFDVTNNYWGAANGPSGDGPGSGDSVYSDAYKTGQWNYKKSVGIETYSPWATSLINISSVPAPTAQVNLSATATSSTQINLSWTNTSNNATAQYVLRSTDNVNFTTVATLTQVPTSYSDTGLTAGTTYYYKLQAGNSGGTSPTTATVSATTPQTPAVSGPISNLQWTSATSGYGTTQNNRSVNGNPIKLRGTTYATGLGTHAASTIVYNLAGRYTGFLSDVGVDDEVNGKGTGSVNFQVYGDGRLLYDSGVLTNGSAVASLSVDVTGVQNLTLKANSVNGDIDFAHADWANARLLVGAQAPGAPTNVSATPLSTSAIKVAWQAAGGAAATGFKIDRSLDGSNWAQVGTVGASVLNYTDTGLTAGTTYRYRVRATNSVGDSPNSAVVSAVPQTPAAVTTQLSSLNWTSATAGYGSVQKNLNASGDPLNVNGVAYASGVGTHADSTIVYNLAGGYKTFQSDFGYDFRTNGKPSDAVYFQVIGDGRVLFDSGAVTNPAATRSLSVDVTGVSTLTLVVKAVVAGNIDYCHVDWAGAKLIS